MHNKKEIWVLLGIVLLLFPPGLKAQDYQAVDFTKELNVKFLNFELKQIDKGVELLNSAEKLFEQSKEMYSVLSELEKKEELSDDYIKALKALLEASKIYEEGNSTIFEVFKTKCETFWESMKKVQHYAAGVEKGRYYERQAKKHLARAEQRREQAEISEKFEYALRKIKEATELEQLAIRDQGRALQVYIDYPVEYNYGWEDDVTLEEILELFKNPAVNEPPDDIFATVDPDKKIDTSLIGEIIFKVQIAAHTVPLTEEYLRTIYKGGMKIDMIYEDEWYKYSIGRYKEFEEATKTLEECKVRKAFIVAYQEGKKLTIKEALELLERKKMSFNLK